MDTTLSNFPKVNKSPRLQSAELWIAYWMYFLFIPASIGLAINYIKANQYANLSKIASSEEKVMLFNLKNHHDWLMRTFIVVAFLFMISIGTLYVGVGYFVAAAAIIWWFYRIIRGMIALSVNEQIPRDH